VLYCGRVLAIDEGKTMVETYAALMDVDCVMRVVETYAATVITERVGVIVVDT